MKYFYILSFTLLSVFGFSQSLECDDLVTYVERNGSKDWWDLNSIDLIKSEWLDEVKGYKIEDNYVVIANFKKWNGVFWEYKKYIFCGIPERNWEAFKAISFDKTYGEKFHAYIYNYKCNCD